MPQVASSELLAMANRAILGSPIRQGPMSLALAPA